MDVALAAKVLGFSTLKITSLNPCCNGCCSRSSFYISKDVPKKVSILVVMDVALAAPKEIRRKNNGGVSILVVMDVALADLPLRTLKPRAKMSQSLL